MDQQQMIAGVDDVGCDEGGGGRSCASHEICGQHLKLDDVFVFRAEVECSNDEDISGDLDIVVKAYVLRSGSQACHVGFLPRRLLQMRDKYANKMATVVEDLRKSDNSQKRRRSERNRGIVRCLMLSDIEEQFRE
ncbi:hypothetical protein PC120_g7285 [Phytophthora cactorum]|nr:hypothetical protein PC120_g7285 [Phytophthora cactorum]